MRSKGISRQIDLTENNVFENGVGEILGDKQYHPGVLPWDDDGNIKNHVLLSDKAYMTIRREFDNWVTLSSTSTNYLYLDELTWNDIDNVSRLSDDPEDVIPKLSYVTFFIKDDKVFKKYPDYIIQYKDNLDSFNSISYNSSWIQVDDSPIYTYSNKYTDTTITSSYKERTTDVTPEKFKDVKLSKEELSGNKIICGEGEKLKLKYEKYFYLIKLKAILDEFNSYMKKDNEDVRTCEMCGKPMYNKIPVSKYYSTLCHECKVYGFANETRARLGRRFTENVDLHNQEMFGECSPCFYDQQVNYYMEDHDGSIDYYHQPVYEDRGLHILRPPVGSHELNVNLSTGEFMDEEDIPRRNRFFSKPDLVYKRRKNRNSLFVNRIDSSFLTVNTVNSISIDNDPQFIV